jgi:hypothetical protein
MLRSGEATITTRLDALVVAYNALVVRPLLAGISALAGVALLPVGASGLLSA